MTLFEQIQGDLLQAMRNREKERTSTLRLLLATMAKIKIEKKLKDASDLQDSDILDCITKNIKTLNQEIEALINAGRDTSKQENEKKLLLTYLPKQMSVNDVIKEVSHAIFLTNKGEIDNPMKYLSQRLKGKVDMKMVSDLVKEMTKKDKEVG